MNHSVYIRRLSLASIALLLPAGIAWGQPPPVPPAETGEPLSQQRPFTGEGQPPRMRHAQEGGYVEQWLQMQKEKNPAEFERMRRLRAENPEQFQREMRQKWQSLRERGGSGSAEHPAVDRMMRQLPPEDREWLARRIGGGHGMGEFRVSDEDRVEIEKGEKALQALVAAYRAAPNDTERAAAGERLKKHLAEQFERHDLIRRRQIESMRKRLDELTAQMEERKAKQGEAIERRMNELIAPPAKPAGAP